ncbi:MAG TPA: hypothetical protein VNQ79_21025 [Blastocatellia bacterium]|nr:hypothetical protein [Blastocatellia bacterium]
MREWLEVNLDTEKLKQSRKIRDIVVELLVSPYDVPEAVRGFFDQETNRFAVEFKYMGGVDEPGKDHQQDRYLKFRIGENSGRLYRLEIDVNALKANSVELRMLVEQEVSEALDQLIQRSGRINRQDNYRLAKEAIAARQDQLFGALAQVA